MVTGIALVVVVTSACGGDSTPVEAGGPTVPLTAAGTSTSVPDTVPGPTTAPPPATTPPPAPDLRSVPFDQDFPIDVGESVAIAGQGLTVTYVAILGDSRCPIGVQCIWAGNATIAVSLVKAGDPPATVQLNTMEGPTGGGYSSYTVTLVELDRGASPGATLRIT
ncbi:MAG: hypothetical protein QOG43_2024 [Actinomycetota bacterium]|nr:hypothetical protein [Actinomycetota bacterium]